MEPVIQLATAFLAQADRDPVTQNKYADQGYYDDPRAIAIARIIEQDLGVKEVEILGAGSFGVAAATRERGGDVIKLTLDSSEVESGTVLVNTPPAGYPTNVVRVQGAWYLRKLKILAESWFDLKKDETHVSQHRVGLLRMERVTPWDFRANYGAAQGLGEYVRYVKREHKLWPHQLRGLSREKIRQRFLEAGQELEGLLMGIWSNQHEQVARDVARAIHQLRDVGIYGIDFHPGNLGWAAASEPFARGKSEQQRVDAAFTGAGERRENPHSEETLRYRGVYVDLLIDDDDIPKGMGTRTYHMRIGGVEGKVRGPFASRAEAVQAAYDEIDYRPDFYGATGGVDPAAVRPSLTRQREERDRAAARVHDSDYNYKGHGIAYVWNDGRCAVEIDGKRYEPTFLRADAAIDYAHSVIDERERGRPEPDAGPAGETRIYKVFDIGMSSLAAGSPKPAEMPASSSARRKKILDKQLSLGPPLSPSGVKVQELG